MSRILILYHSRSGNTEQMAMAVAEGAISVPGTQAELNYYVPPEELMDFDAVLVEAAAYRHDVPVAFKNYFEEAAVKNVILKGKVGEVSGHTDGVARPLYWFLRYEEQVGHGSNLAAFVSSIYADQAGPEKCFALGRRVAESLIDKA
jgi:flavodoxin